MPSTPLRIAAVNGRQILDSRGRPTVEADVTLSNGTMGRASVPSGASTGRHEALELRDRDPSLYDGLGVTTTVENVRGEVSRSVMGLDPLDQQAVDAAMIEADGTPVYSRLGANALLAVSLATARAGAQASGIALHRYIARLAGATPSMPMPMVNILSGGAHAGRGMDLQDFLAVPVGSRSYSQGLEMISRVRSHAAHLMKARGLTTLLADEGGLSPGFGQAEQALSLMVEAFEAAGLRPGEDMGIALDVAASELFEDGSYVLGSEKRKLSGEAMVDFIADMVDRYPIVSVEDALEQDDWSHWQDFTRRARSIQVVGDDLFVTNVERIGRGVEQGVANAALIKLNQNGTLTGTLAAMAAARAGGYATVVSARSGETEDAFIADLAVGTGAGQIKIGSVRNSERLAKYNQLLRIEEEVDLPFAGMSGFAGADAMALA